MTFVIFIIQFAVGLLAIIKGADWLTDGAASIARRFGIPSIVIGLTIVAMGSSAPEFVVSVVSALQGNTDMALGNVVGSNIFNILAIMGITALVREIKVDRSNIRYDVPFAVLSSVAIAITVLDTYLDGAAENTISRSDGLMLLCLFGVFMSYTVAIASKGKGQTDSGDGNATDVEQKRYSTLKAWGMIVVGLACLIIGGKWFVDGASGIASLLGLSDAIIALTIVSGGTSAPELAASIMAARKGDTAMALGNVVGSVSFNVFFVLGTAASIHPLGLGGVTIVDIATVLGAAVVLWMFCKFGKTYYTLTRLEGAIMTLMAVAYYTFLVMQA